jgi:FkbM family methyltransferase
MLDSSGPVAYACDGGRQASYVRWERRLPGLLTHLGLPADGVVQVGAHTGQEVEAFMGCGFRRMVLVEPNRDHAAALNRRLNAHHRADGSSEPAYEVVMAAAGRQRGQATLHVTEYDQQASLLPPKPPLVVTRRDAIPVIPVHDVQHGCNVLVMDVQGAELEVLAGTDLDRLDLAVIEGSTWARYSGGSTLETISAYMRAQGWRQVASFPHARPHVFDVVWLAPRAGRVPPDAV